MKEISDEVKIGDSATPFKSVRKCLAIDKTASHFDNANLKKPYTAYQAWNSQCRHGSRYPWNHRPDL